MTIDSCLGSVNSTWTRYLEVELDLDPEPARGTQEFELAVPNNRVIDTTWAGNSAASASERHLRLELFLTDARRQSCYIWETEGRSIGRRYLVLICKESGQKIVSLQAGNSWRVHKSFILHNDYAIDTLCYSKQKNTLGRDFMLGSCL
ncbi:uncharacterized protein RCO7_14912 [Rhynchosporium graminicola]|uniref:Uncharacterized protein n=1 Tax=Rhynchosporium graminicola TaxID=2792576 RepID=A0A1E1L9X8_9HELO|nr:uncharacterized protein RCO7_14912 [Rhynchosporium commune]